MSSEKQWPHKTSSTRKTHTHTHINLCSYSFWDNKMQPTSHRHWSSSHSSINLSVQFLWTTVTFPVPVPSPDVTSCLSPSLSHRFLATYVCWSLDWKKSEINQTECGAGPFPSHTNRCHDDRLLQTLPNWELWVKPDKTPGVIWVLSLRPSAVTTH